MLQDFIYALRVMARARTISAVAIVTLALGIGVNTAIFSIVDAVLLRPLPYAEPDRLVMVWQDLRPRGGPATEWTGPSQQFDWKADTDVFENLASVRGWGATLSGGDLPESVQGEQTTYEYFDVLGVRPALGRTFRDADDVPGAARVVVLSHALWTRRFGGDPGLIGRTIPISGESHEVIGVMPAGFRPAWVAGAELWRPLRLNRVNPTRNGAVFHTIGRLRRGVGIEQARAGLATLAARLQRAHPESDANKTINPVPLQEQLSAPVRTPLLLLQAAVALVLLIACVNVANLLLSRASGRTRELAVRRALGADRWRIVQQMLTESTVLAIAGGALGVVIAVWGVAALQSLAPAGTLRVADVGLNGRALAFALLLSVTTGVLFGLVPAAHAARDRVHNALKQGARGQIGDGGGRARHALIVAELALALVLLVGSGLLLRTFLALQHADLGFNPDRILTGFVLPPGTTYKTAAQRVAFYDALLARASTLPGVRMAALSSVVPLGGDGDTDFEIEGRPKAATSADTLTTWYRVTSANYFATLEIPLKRGRLFQDRDSEPTVVINETMAARHWPAADPIGQRVRFGNTPWFTIVGVVGDVHARGARADRQVETYIPYRQVPDAGVNVVLKTAGDPLVLAEPLRRAVKELDPGIAVAGIASMDQLIDNSVAASRFVATLIGAFAMVALLLAAIGTYGVMSNAVAQRTQEIGVRLALGAGEGQIFALVVGQSLRLAALGLTLGLAGSLAAGQALKSLLFGVGSADPATIGGTAAILVAVALLAAYVPARRAMRIDPMTALRVE